MELVRTLRTLKITSLPSYAIGAAQWGFTTARKDLQDWASVVDFIVRPVDVNLALENGDIDLTRTRRAS